MQTLRYDVQKEFSGKLQAECEKSAETIRELQAALKKHRETIVRRDQALLQFNETKQALEKWRAECVRQKELLAALRDTVSRRDASLEKLKLERETTVRKTEHLQQLLAEQKSVIDRRETEYRQQKELLAALRDTVSYGAMRHWKNRNDVLRNYPFHWKSTGRQLINGTPPS